MKRFNIEYFTAAGEALYICFDGVGQFPMHACGNGVWSAQFNAECGTVYHYELRDTNGTTLRQEEYSNHIVDFDGDVEFFDRWQLIPDDKPFYSTLFTQGVFHREKRIKNTQPSDNELILQVEAPTLRADEVLAVVGENELLGAWIVEQALIMNDSQAPIWSIALPKSVQGSEYKFVILNSQTNALIQFEAGDNRRMPISRFNKLIVKGLQFLDPRRRWHGAGVAVPLFSLRSEQDWGCGDFRSLKLFADWVSSVGMSVVQLLPINDTSASFTWRDSYPYNAISSFALHPMYASAQGVMEQCLPLVDEPTKRKLRNRLTKYAKSGMVLNNSTAVDYEAVVKLKNQFLREVYNLCGEKILSTKQYKEFYRQSSEWLLPYMVYCTLRDRYSTVDFSKWPELSRYSRVTATRFAKQNAKEVGYHSFVQYILDCELRAVSDYMHSRGLALKGDIPIGVSPVSVDVWSAPELYNTSMSAGAPPDAFAAEGQNWGFPTYNWERMAKDGYAWWRRRLAKMARYFDAYRIDHILGFFRIWEVPRGAASAIMGHFYPSKPFSADEIFSRGFEFDAKSHVAKDLSNSDTLFLPYLNKKDSYVPRIEGYKCHSFARLSAEQQQAYLSLHEDFFYHRHNDFWRENAMRRLPRLMESNEMLTCGEDLGMIPACVPDVMAGQRILSLEIERMPKSMGIAFGDTASYPYLSVAATSTHDMSTIRGWWREDNSLTQRYWNEVLHREGSAEKECSPQTAREIIARHMLSGSMLAILPLQDWLAIDAELRADDPDSERINIPSNANHYWQYRVHLPIEQILEESEFNNSVSELVAMR